MSFSDEAHRFQKKAPLQVENHFTCARKCWPLRVNAAWKQEYHFSVKKVSHRLRFHFVCGRLIAGLDPAELVSSIVSEKGTRVCGGTASAVL